MPTIPSGGGLVPDDMWLTVGDDGKLTAGSSLLEMSEEQINAKVERTELYYAQGLNADSSDNIWVDPFVDYSKIASSSNVAITTGQNGYISLGASLPSGSDYQTVADKGDTTSNFTGTSSCTVTATSNMIVTEVSAYLNHSTSLTATIKDSEGKVLAQNTASGSNYSVCTVSLSDSDYSRAINSGEQFEIEVSSNDEHSSNSSATFNEARMDVDGQRVPSTSGGDPIFETADVAYNSSGTATSVTIDKGYTPSALQPDMDVETDSETTVDIRAFDGNGNEQTWTESELGESKSVSFTSSSFQLELQPQTSNSSKTPQINDVGTNVIE